MEPKIIFFDLEIIPNLNKALEYWTQLSSKFECKTMKATVSSICCVGWMELGKKRVHCINAWDFDKWDEDVNDDYEVCKAIYEVLNGADAVVTWNGARFDWPYLQTRLMYHGLPTLAKVNHVDLCLVSRRNLRIINNQLGTVGHELIGESKLAHTGWKLWVETHGGVKKAMALMSKYCKQDVALLAKCYDKLLPFVNSLPNLNNFRSVKQMLDNKKVCPNCGSTNLRRNGYRHTRTMTYVRMLCMHCHTSSRTDSMERKPRAI